MDRYEPMASVLDASDVKAVLPFERAIHTLEDGFRAFARGDFTQPQRLTTRVDRGSLAAMPAIGRKMTAVKVVTVHPQNPDRGLPAVQATVLLLRTDTGELLAIIDGTALTVIRTAAASAVATRYLSNSGPADLGILGAGPLAAGHVRAMAVVRPLRQARVYSPHVRQRWQAFTTQLTGLDLDVQPADSAEDVVRSSNLLVLATSSTHPVLNWTWVRPGTHINAVGGHLPNERELDTETVSNSRIVCDSVEACWEEAGDLLIPLGEGAIQQEHASISLGDVLLDRTQGRRSPSEVTVFKSVGLAFQDLCSATVAWENAMRAGMGKTGLSESVPS
jgi:alanine dehydrogenase